MLIGNDADVSFVTDFVTVVAVTDEVIAVTETVVVIIALILFYNNV